MKKAIYIDQINKKLGYTKKEIEEITDEYINILSERLVESDKVSITRIGTIQKKLIQPKVIFSPIDGKICKADSYYRLSLTCSAQLLDKLKKNIK